MSNGRSLDPFRAHGRSGSIRGLGSRDYSPCRDSDRSIEELMVDPRQHGMKKAETQDQNN